MRDIHPFGGHHALCSQTLRTECRNVSLDERIQLPQFIDADVRGYPDKRRSAPVVLSASPSCGHLKKEHASMQVGNVNLNFMESGSEPGGNGRRHRISSECGAVENLLAGDAQQKRAIPRDVDRAR